MNYFEVLSNFEYKEKKIKFIEKNVYLDHK
jgi:hypothetical protein